MKENNIFDEMIDSINDSPLLFLHLKEPNAWVKALKDKVSCNDKIRVHGNNVSETLILFKVMYNKKYDPDRNLVIERYKCVKEIYYRWCSVKNIKPNPNEGWFKSKKFKKYLDSINYDQVNYVVMITI